MRVRRDYLAALLAFAATDDSRPVLTGAWVTGSEIAAADGFTLAVAPCEEPGSLDGKILSVAAIKLAMKVIPRRAEFVTFRGHKDHAYIVGEFGLVKVPYIEGTAPNYKDLMRPDQLAVTAEKVALNAGFLSRVATAVKAFAGSGIVRVRLGQTPRDAVEFHCQADGAPPMRFVVMPMFVAWEDEAVA